MPEILAIKNLTISHSFLISDPSFVFNVTAMPGNPVDEVVIRTIIWNGQFDNVNQTYYPWVIQSNINHDIIGCVSGGTTSTSNPGTRILLSAPFPQQLQFRLMHPSTLDNSPPVEEPLITGDIIIQMDLISYRRSHVH